MADQNLKSSRLAEQFKSLFTQMQKVVQDAKHQDIFASTLASSDLSPLQRHIFHELSHDQPLPFALVHDELTGLLLRTSMLDCFERTLNELHYRDKFSAVCFIDLDGFKEINDQHGHVIGDQALGLVGACLKNSIRSEDLLCRWGGDEFIVVLQNIEHKDYIMNLANRLLNAISSPMRLNTNEPLTLFLGASIGVSVIEPGNSGRGKNALALIEAADGAMYRAKRAGKNCIRFAE
ncbi:GGDEF domain-containing protein [Polynucleobacter sp. MWH-UH23A]|uniref:GGDEF domain-containing protein n=1 Tax=Polynucleobacter sp. MWH-UH23A TaxID=1855613 RepID=UPI003364BE43